MFPFHTSPYVFLYGKNKKMLASRKHKIVNTNRKGCKKRSKLSYCRFDKVNYYALNKILNSDWLNTNLTSVDVWLVGSNVRQRNLMSGWQRRHVINVIPFRTQY